MESIKKFIFFILIALFTLQLKAQTGIPYITFIESKEHFEAENWSICQDDHFAMLFANKKGLRRYDGNEWKNVTVPFVPAMVKKNPYTDRVYLMSDNEYGFFERDVNGREKFVALTYKGELNDELKDIYFTDSLVVFLGKHSLSIHNNYNGELKQRFFAEPAREFTGIFEGGGKLFTNVYGKGIAEIIPDSLIFTNDKTFLATEILFSLPYDDNRNLLGTENNDLYLFDGNNFEKFSISRQDYLNENILSGALTINDELYALSTLYGGIVIIEKKDGALSFILNYDNGLPDDEIMAMTLDGNTGLWLSYAFGVCRVDLSVPIREYTNYPGLEGLVTNAVWYKDELYISTTEGLFYLAEVKNYDEVEILLKRDPVPEKEIETSELETESGSELVKEKRGLFKRLFSRKSDSLPKTQVSEELPDIQQEDVKPSYYTKKISKLRSIDHLYKKVPGINSRCDMLMIIEEQLFVGSSSGLFEVNDHDAEMLIRARGVNHVLPLRKNSLLVSSKEGVFIVRKSNHKWENQSFLQWGSATAISASLFGEKLFIGGLDRILICDTLFSDSTHFQEIIYESVYPEEIHLNTINDTVFSFTSSYIKYYEPDLDSFVVYLRGGYRPEDFHSLEYFSHESGKAWIKTDESVLRPGSEEKRATSKEYWRLFEEITAFFQDEEKGNILVDDHQRIFHFVPGEVIANDTNFRIFITEIANEAGQLFDPEKLVFDSQEKLISIGVTAPYFLKNQSTRYHYKIEGRMENWSKWSPKPELEILPEYGQYNIQIRAKNILNELSDPINITLKVNPPFYKTTLFYLLLVPGLAFLFFLLFFFREKKLKRDKRILEEKVQERTTEIEMQKQEIEAQKNDITSSITYASRIQQAILPSKKLFDEHFSEYFIFFKPRDIVSGDFYWINKSGGRLIFAAADCTGHGVPGAFMSMLGNSFLNEITKEGSLPESSGEILNQLREKLTLALSQSGGTVEATDGMDIALCSLDLKKKKLQYSGAYNSLIHIRGRDFYEYKGDRMPIGYYPDEKKFITQSIDLKKGDLLYLFTDGFQDQFGGPRGKKYTTPRFRKLLTKISSLPMQDQFIQLDKDLSTWIGDFEQLDDILVLGLRI